MQASSKTNHRTIEAYDVLPPEPVLRRHASSVGRPVMVEDAIFEVIGPAGLRPQFNDNPAPRKAARGIDYTKIMAFAGVYLVNRVENFLSHLSPQAFVTLIASLFFLVFWLFGGFGALANQPAPASATSPFTIENVFTDRQDANGMKVLVVSGALVNQTGKTLAAPELVVAGQSGETIGTIRPQVSRIEARATIRFAARFKLAGGKSGAITIFPQSP